MYLFFYRAHPHRGTPAHSMRMHIIYALISSTANPLVVAGTQRYVLCWHDAASVWVYSETHHGRGPG